MTYKEFRRAYVNTVCRMLRCTSKVEASRLASKSADLCDSHPEWAERVENEWHSFFPHGPSGRPSAEPVFSDDLPIDPSYGTGPEFDFSGEIEIV